MTDPGSTSPAAIAPESATAPLPATPATATDPVAGDGAAHPAAPSAHRSPLAPAAPPAAPDAPPRGRRAPRAGRRRAAAPAAPAPSGAPRAGTLLTLVLGSLTALPALSMDMYLPALPQVGGALHTSASTAQLTLTACLLGLAVGQLVVGPMSDQLGRRRPLLIGMGCYVLASAACALAPTAPALTAFRLVQGLSGAAGIVIARAVVRDLFDGLAMARFFSSLMLISGIAPIVAPVLGGQILRFTDWRGVFFILTGIGTLLTLVSARWLHETLPPAARHRGGLRDALRTMRGLFADRVFTGYLVAGSLAFAGLFAYVAASPFVVQDVYGASPQTFSLLFMVNSVGLVACGQINGKILVGRVPLDRVLGFGLCVTGLAATGLLLLTSGAFGSAGLFPVAAGLCGLMSGMGFVMPNANSQGLMRARGAAGSASALLGTSQFLVGALASPLVGLGGGHTAVPMALVQLVSLLLAAGAFLGLCRPWRPRG